MMAIRLRKVDGLQVALCVVESDAKPGDVYLDDAAHYALAAKFAQDWQGQDVVWQYPAEWAAMATQKLSDASEEHKKWSDQVNSEDRILEGAMNLLADKAIKGDAEGYARGIEASAMLASSFASIVHGHLPVNPHECAEQVAKEIAAGIRALLPTSGG